MKSIVLTGGGTAGHVMPHIAILEKLKNHFDQIAYIGSIGGMEKSIITKHKEIEYHEISASKLNRSHFFKNLLLPFKLAKSVNQAKKLLKKIKPDIVFSKGGYVALPVVLAAKSLKIPVVSHESDLSVGLANKLAKNCSKAICTTFEKTAKDIGKKGVWTGSPIVESYCETIKKDKPILLVTGGSLGAKAINQVVFDCASELSKNFYVIHQVGKNNLNKNINISDYKQIEFTNNMEQLIKSSSVIISRAGSNTIFELAYHHKPMILIPLPKGASRGDQIENAKYFAQNNYCKLIYQEELNTKTLINAVNEVYLSKDSYINQLKNAKIPNGTDKIIEILLKNI
ncbi:MAG: undecaprenyldiphospho-muramoylpentapeptide beta-N-acetylglucosaminyltransferase [Clostridia bacterium]|nr:undecaprenyldiphospho-muramoylpentapeptide beta-N-acetylglucosaminyltransferase [Clostridia bacterium]